MDEKVLKSSICSVSLVTKIRIIQYNSYIYKYYLGYHKATRIYPTDLFIKNGQMLY